MLDRALHWWYGRLGRKYWVVLAIGFLVSFVVALGVVAWFMRWVRARGFAPFAIYRIALGIALLIAIARGTL